MASPQHKKVTSGAAPGCKELARAEELVTKAVAGLQTMDDSLDRQVKGAVLQVEVMFEANARRQRIVDACAGRQFAMQELAIVVRRRRRHRPPAETGGRIDPFRLIGACDEGGRVGFDL